MSVPQPILDLPKNKFANSHQTFLKCPDNIDIEYGIIEEDYTGIMGGEFKTVVKNFIDMLEKNIISKHCNEYCYYIENNYDSYLPSPFSSSNYADFIIPTIFHKLYSSNMKEYIFKIKFFPTSKTMNFFDQRPQYKIKILKNN